jgi:transposase
MEHPAAVCAKAQRLEELLLRVAAGEALAEVCADLGLTVSEAEVVTLQARYEAGGRTWEALVDRRYGHPQKMHSGIREWLYARKRENAALTAEELAQQVAQQFQVTVSVGHINYLLRRVGLTGPRGRRFQTRSAPAREGEEEDPEPAEVANVGVFFLEGAKQVLEVVEPVEQAVEQAREDYRQEHPQASLRLLASEPETTWHKLDHLLYLPVLGLTRPRDLYYYQGEGLEGLYGFTYKYLPLEHFLGELTRLRVGQPLGQALSHRYQEVWYPEGTPLVLLADWHVKPHWTKQPSHSGVVSMWGRVMPGTKQLLLHGPAGHLLGAWNYPIDTHMRGVLVDLEADLEEQWHRPVDCTVVDGEGNGLPLAERYTAAERDYLSLLGRQGDRSLGAFAVVGEWRPVIGDPEHEAVEARWQDPAKAEADPRRLVLMRRKGETDPTRVYAGRIPEEWRPEEVPGQYRQRWPAQERGIRQMVNGANLNANYGYTTQAVVNRTQRRRWAEAQAKVEACERKLAEQQEARHNRWAQLRQLRQTYRQEYAAGQQALAPPEPAEEAPPSAAPAPPPDPPPPPRGARVLEQLRTRFQRGRQRLLQELRGRLTRRKELHRELAERQAARAAIDTQTLCQERELEKDQIMLDVQGLLTTLHDGVCQHFLAPEWQRLELPTALELIYRKRGRVQWGTEEVQVVLERYRYAEQQRAMEETCRRFNALQVRWRDGRLLRISVEGDPKIQLCNCQGAGQT